MAVMLGEYATNDQNYKQLFDYHTYEVTFGTDSSSRMEVAHFTARDINELVCALNQHPFQGRNAHYITAIKEVAYCVEVFVGSDKVLPAKE